MINYYIFFIVFILGIFLLFGGLSKYFLYISGVGDNTNSNMIIIIGLFLIIVSAIGLSYADYEIQNIESNLCESKGMVFEEGQLASDYYSCLDYNGLTHKYKLTEEEKNGRN